jgi:hypothetical protein
MALLYFFLLLASLVALLVGLIKPSLVGWWSKNATRRQVLGVYLLASVLAFVLSGAFTPHPGKKVSLTTPKVTEVDVVGEAFDVPGLSSKGKADAYGINSSGQIVGEFYYYIFNERGPAHGFLRNTNGSFTTIDVPGSSSTDVRGINDSGQIVGEFWDSKGGHGFLVFNLPRTPAHASIILTPAPVVTKGEVEKQIKEEAALIPIDAIKRIVSFTMGEAAFFHGVEYPIIINIKIQEEPSKGTIAEVKVRRMLIFKPWESTIREAREFARSFYKDRRCSHINSLRLIFNSWFLDDYGNWVEKEFARVELDRSDAEKINWENMDNERFYKLLETRGGFWISSEIDRD